MFAAGDRSGFQLRGLADGTGHGRNDRRIRQEVYARIKSVLRVSVVATVLSSVALVSMLARYSTLCSVKRTKRITRLVQLFSRSMLKFLNVTCVIEARPGQDFDHHAGMLIIPNHLSYLDVLVINALFPAVFVTSREIEETPVLGQITKVAGCTFVERRHKQCLHKDIDRLSSLLNEGINVTLFPEGTTTAGDVILPFKKSLFEAAVRSKARVVPVCLKYESVDGEPFTHFNHDKIAWYGDMSFFPHLMKLVSVSSITVRLSVLSDMEFRGHKSRKRLADDTRQKIVAHYFA